MDMYKFGLCVCWLHFFEHCFQYFLTICVCFFSLFRIIFSLTRQKTVQWRALRYAMVWALRYACLCMFVVCSFACIFVFGMLFNCLSLCLFLCLLLWQLILYVRCLRFFFIVFDYDVQFERTDNEVKLRVFVRVLCCEIISLWCRSGATTSREHFVHVGSLDVFAFVCVYVFLCVYYVFAFCVYVFVFVCACVFICVCVYVCLHCGILCVRMYLHFCV